MTRNPGRIPTLALMLTLLFPAARLPGQGPPLADTLRLTLREAQRLSLERSPSFLAEREVRAMARGDLRQARVFLPNPRVEVEAPGAATSGAIGRYEAVLSQEIEWAGQRGLRIGAAEHGERRAAAEVRDAARRSVAEASTAYYAALTANRRLTVAEEIFAANDRLLRAVRTQVREGEVSHLEGNLGEIEVARARARVLAARREAASAELALKRTIGLAAGASISLADDLPEPPDPAALQSDSLVRLALERRPDLAAHTAAVAERESTARLARREGVPNLEIRSLAGREEASGRASFGIGLGVPFPLWNRNQGTVARLQAEVQQAAWSRSAAELRIRTEVADALQGYIAASHEADIYERDVRQRTEESLRLLEVAYREGKIDLPTLLLLRNQLLDAELGYWDAWLARRRSLVELEAATGLIGAGLSELEPVSNNDMRGER